MGDNARVLSFPQTPKMGKLPKRTKNKDLRTREYLTEQEVELLMNAARKTGRHGHRDATLILLMYRHGFRVSELVSLRWEQIDLKQGLLHVNRGEEWIALITSDTRAGDSCPKTFGKRLSRYTLCICHRAKRSVDDLHSEETDHPGG